MHRRFLRSAPFLLALLAALPAAAQRTAADVAREASRRVEARRGGASDFVVAYELLEIPVELYYSPTVTPLGEFWFPVPYQGEAADPLPLMGLVGPAMATAGMEVLLHGFPERFGYRGVEQAGGRAAHVLTMRLADLPDEAFGDALDARQGMGEAEMVLFVDTLEYLPLRLEAAGFQGMGGTAGRLEVDFADFRAVEGVTLPHRLTVALVGVFPPADSAQLAELKRELEADPLAGGPERRLKEWLLRNADEIGRTGRAVLEGTVTAVRVNVGPPVGLRDHHEVEEEESRTSRPPERRP
jgi:hypothetical protein